VAGHNGRMDVAPEAAGSESLEALTGRPAVETTSAVFWSREQAMAAKRAPLRIYLGAAPGVGKTFAMLSEAHRRRDRGSDVVVGLVETYGRPKTTELVAGLDVQSSFAIDYRGVTIHEMDTAALIKRHPEAGAPKGGKTS
jgi:K+-sensing histidine kinase KdpD